MSKKRGPTPRRVWQPLQRAVAAPSEKAKAFADSIGLPGHDAIWMNDRYTVFVTYWRLGPEDTVSEFVRELSIKRIDKQWPNDWRDAMRIKNQLAGESVWAIELYPAQSHVVDTANQRYLWCFMPGTRPTWDGKHPVGFREGLRLDPDEGPDNGSVQREFDPVDPPRDRWAERVESLIPKAAKAAKSTKTF